MPLWPWKSLRQVAPSLKSFLQVCAAALRGWFSEIKLAYHDLDMSWLIFLLTSWSYMVSLHSSRKSSLILVQETQRQWHSALDLRRSLHGGKCCGTALCTAPSSGGRGGWLPSMEPMGWFHVVLNILVALISHIFWRTNHIQPYPTIITTHRTDFSTSQGLWHMFWWKMADWKTRAAHAEVGAARPPRPPKLEARRCDVPTGGKWGRRKIGFWLEIDSRWLKLISNWWKIIHMLDLACKVFEGGMKSDFQATQQDARGA